MAPDRIADSAVPTHLRDILRRRRFTVYAPLTHDINAHCRMGQLRADVHVVPAGVPDSS